MWLSVLCVLCLMTLRDMPVKVLNNENCPPSARLGSQLNPVNAFCYGNSNNDCQHLA